MRDTADDEDILALRRKLRKGDTSIEKRRLIETKPVSYSARRRLAKKTDRTEGTFFKFTRPFKSRLAAVALSEGRSMVDVVEDAFTVYDRLPQEQRDEILDKK